MAKMVSQEAEKAKTSVRSVRHKALDAVKKAFRAADDRARMDKEVSGGCVRLVTGCVTVCLSWTSQVANSQVTLAND